MKPPPTPPLFDAPEPVMRAAGAWLARRDRGFTPVEADEFERWRRAEPSHEAAVAQLEQTMNAFDRLQDYAGVADTAPDPDVFAPPARRQRVWFVAAAGGLAAAMALLFLRPSSPTVPGGHIFATEGAQAERAELEDGTIIDLNGHTRLEVTYSPAERRVLLVRGEAHFQVAANPARPFVVLAGSIAARAVGTAFSVRLDRREVAVLVTEGKVRVAPQRSPAVESTGEGTLLGPGEQAVIALASPTATSQVARFSTEQISQRLAWQPRLLEVSNARLADLVAEMNRRSAQSGRPHIVIDHEELNGLRIGGSIDYDQPEAFVRLLEKSFGVRVDRETARILLRPAR